ncbi:MAG TPA: hypothetical protein VMB34_31465 [Acetobacteraceae bacterium]|nr:hypothetical protein [Acetobacteraceae bacterium]HUB47315.1 hypothetical protein [Acetobacteraceae bacterium]
MNEFIKIRPAPNGKVYAVWGDQPICAANGGLLYFDDQHEALEFIKGHDAELELQYTEIIASA